MQAGFYGEVPSRNFITGDELATMVDLTAGKSQNSDEPWLKFAWENKIIYVAKKPFRYELSYEDLKSKGLDGNKIVEKYGLKFKVTMFDTLSKPLTNTSDTEPYKYSQYNKLMLPIHEKAGTKQWLNPEYIEVDLANWNIGYTDEDLGTIWGLNGTGSICLSTANFQVTDYTVIYRGPGTKNRDASSRGIERRINSLYNYFGWRPVLELIN